VGTTAVLTALTAATATWIARSGPTPAAAEQRTHAAAAIRPPGTTTRTPRPRPRPNRVDRATRNPRGTAHFERIASGVRIVGTRDRIDGHTTIRVAPSWISAYHGNQAVAARMLGAYGWGADQMPPLVRLWTRESNWSTSAYNPSGAYGIPQALPGGKMSSAGGDWQTSAAIQIAWGLHYIAGRYGSPSAAWAHETDQGWY